MNKLELISHEAICKIYNIKESSDYPFCITNYKDENNKYCYFTRNDHLKATTRILKNINDKLETTNIKLALEYAETLLYERFDKDIFKYIVEVINKIE